MRVTVFLSLLLLTLAVPAADTLGSGWPGGAGMPWSALPGQSPSGGLQGVIPWSTTPGQGPGQSLGQDPGQGGGAQGLIPWSSPGASPGMTRPGQSGAVAPSPPVNLTGTWRGSGGELVDIQRNTARVWGTGDQYCLCIFMVHGDRLIAYSPDTDVVRKYQFYADRDRFLLRDEDGQTMWFQRVR